MATLALCCRRCLRQSALHAFKALKAFSLFAFNGGDRHGDDRLASVAVLFESLQVPGNGAGTTRILFKSAHRRAIQELCFVKGSAFLNFN